MSRGRTLKYQITVCEQVPADSEIYQIEKGNAGDNKGNEIILSTCSAKANIRIVLYRNILIIKLGCQRMSIIMGFEDITAIYNFILIAVLLKLLSECCPPVRSTILPFKDIIFRTNMFHLYISTHDSIQHNFMMRMFLYRQSGII